MAQIDQYQAEWQQAQDRYRAGVNAGYDATDADQMYLAPVREKWNILNTLPISARAKASEELDKAHIDFLQGIQSGYKPQDAANLYLIPKLEEWKGAANVPTEKLPKTKAEVEQWYNSNPAMQDEASEAQQQISDGVPVRSAIEGHPMLLKAPSFSQTWRPMYESAVQRDETSKAKVAQDNTADGLTLKMFRLAQGRKNFLPEAPIQQFFNQRLGQLESQATNSPTMTPADLPALVDNSSRYAPQMPDDLGTGPVPAGAQPKYLTKFKTSQDVAAAYQGKELSREEAKKILLDQFGIK